MLPTDIIPKSLETHVSLSACMTPTRILLETTLVRFPIHTEVTSVMHESQQSQVGFPEALVYKVMGC